MSDSITLSKEDFELLRSVAVDVAKCRYKRKDWELAQQAQKDAQGNYIFPVWAWFEGSSFGCELFLDTFDRGLAAEKVTRKYLEGEDATKTDEQMFGKVLDDNSRSA